MAFAAPHYQSAPGHSRDSSAASCQSSPITPSFSIRSHSRWPSSSSSLATSPDSPSHSATNKTTLEDLLEESAEREDGISSFETEGLGDEPLCICDTPFCEHQQAEATTPTPFPSFPEWTRGDDRIFSYSASGHSVKRSRSGETSRSTVGSRRRQRLRSISSSLFRERRPTTSVTNHTVQSAPPTPGSSSRRPSITEYLSRQLEPRRTISSSNRRTLSFSNDTGEPSFLERIESREAWETQLSSDPVDREGNSSTPLLPPLLSSLRDPSDEALRSPLQSPSVATQSETASIYSPVPHGLLTPPLSAKPSFTSFNVPPASTYAAPEKDYWAIKLGHANFDIEPRPYMPQQFTRESCRRLLKDWEAARVEYMRVIARVSEHYGPSSPTYSLTEEKWAEIDKAWRSNLDKANAEAEANGEIGVHQSLAETQPLAKMPSLSDPNQPTKFLNVDEANIVGPMVQYTKMQQTSPKRPSFFGVLKDPSSILNRSLFGSKR
ncbi:uncharacterized protein LTR77_004424 [Saxophila tyrrhenica]|uniref:Only prolin and serin are matching in the corresponding protein n=1 Tax=Saxophila tyrrhenica TaxID=1690608 RepID=A0AAV9PFW7_9PEZI|nr:hypothetical protein LTR77_004424 [Saxophila tyrrhenica]